jgi:hypothetical protein
MANTHNSDLDMTHAREPVQDASSEGGDRRLALTGLWMVLGVLTVVILGSFLLISHRAHTAALSPGQPQRPAAEVILNGAGG